MTPSDWSPGAGPWSPGAADPLAVASAQAAALRALHVPGRPVILPNVWDVPSARAVDAAGFGAVATSSAAVAETLGYADGEAAPVAEILDAVARIVRAVGVPVTADLERGYGLRPTELVERLAAAGAAGCNLEDSDPASGRLIDPAEQAEFLAAVCAAARSAGVALVVNARVDAFLHGTGTPEARLGDAVNRAQQYVAAGADCVYPIGLSDPGAIEIFVREVDGPVNILGHPDAGPTPAQLAELGVARISYGSRVHAAMQRAHRDLLTRICAG